MEEDVLLIQCVEDFAYNCDDYSYVDLTGINTALTAFFMPFWSFTPLKEMLLKRFQRMRRMYMKLDVEYDKRTLLVQSLALKCDLMDGDDRSWKYGCREDMNWEGIQACLSDYFRSIGYEKIECKGSEEIIRFIHRLQSDVPLVGEYFKIVPRQDREIARVGYFGTKDEYEIYIEANDKGLLPHCHVRDWKT